MANINTTFGNALVAAALRKGMVKPTDLLQPGMYDPALDWQGQNQNLGYSQSTQDTALGGSRLHESVFGGQGFYADPVTGQRTDYSTPGGLAELAGARARGQEDYNTATQNLGRNYQNLGTQQAGAARAAGVSQGGALHQALQKRQANQGREQGALDTSWRRLVDDNELSRNKLLGQAAQGQQNLDIGASRAGAGNTLFNQQLGEAKVGSAQGMGTLPELPVPSFSAGYNVNQQFGNALANAYYKRIGKKVPS